MSLAMHARIVLPVVREENPPSLWRRFVRWMMEVPPNPLVWYAPNDWPTAAESPKTTVLRTVVLVTHDDLRTPQSR